MHALTLNAGSSSLKAARFDVSAPAEHLIAAADVDRITDPSKFPQAFHDAIAALGRDGVRTPPDVIAHRIVHGGPRYSEPQRLTDDVVRELEALVAIDPDHVPQALAGVRAMGEAYPGVPQIACFDTAFHRTMPPVSQRYPLPRRLWDTGVRRYGFHGLSCEFILAELGRLDPPEDRGKVIVAHLGNGSSMTAIREARSVETTMGFSPTGGLMMGTRSGDLDPTVLLYVQQSTGLTVDRVSDLVNKSAGLLGVSETTSDMRDLLTREPEDFRAADAVALFCHLARRALGGLVAVLGGLDTVVFTAGIGEHAAAVRERICRDLNCFGIELDPNANAANAPVISRGPAVVRVMHTDEDRMLARHARNFLTASGPSRALRAQPEME